MYVIGLKAKHVRDYNIYVRIGLQHRVRVEWRTGGIKGRSEGEGERGWIRDGRLEGFALYVGRD